MSESLWIGFPSACHLVPNRSEFFDSQKKALHLRTAARRQARTTLITIIDSALPYLKHDIFQRYQFIIQAPRLKTPSLVAVLPTNLTLVT